MITVRGKPRVTGEESWILWEPPFWPSIQAALPSESPCSPNYSTEKDYPNWAAAREQETVLLKFRKKKKGRQLFKLGVLIAMRAVA